jgi:rSAM/selenodomain-associated transferase 1
MNTAFRVEPPPGSTLLGIFAKHWEPGTVKTRLAATIGYERAAAVQRAFLETLLARMRPCSTLRRLVITPSEKMAAFREVSGDDWSLEAQSDGDLGRRIHTFFESHLKQAERILLIGSDSPDLPCRLVQQAFDLLASQDLVLGPAADGGYYLVGVANRLSPIFEGIPWSTPEVWQRTIERLQATATAWHALPPWYDVDDEKSLHHLLDNLRLEREHDSHLARLDDRLQEILGVAANDSPGK